MDVTGCLQIEYMQKKLLSVVMAALISDSYGGGDMSFHFVDKYAVIA